RGREPPPRLLRWPNLRRVRVETARRNWYADTGAPLSASGGWGAFAPRSTSAIVRRLLEASPLTDLTCAARVEPPISLTALAACVLRGLCGGVARPFRAPRDRPRCRARGAAGPAGRVVRTAGRSAPDGGIRRRAVAPARAGHGVLESTVFMERRGPPGMPVHL